MSKNSLILLLQKIKKEFNNRHGKNKNNKCPQGQTWKTWEKHPQCDKRPPKKVIFSFFIVIFVMSELLFLVSFAAPS